MKNENGRRDKTRESSTYMKFHVHPSLKAQVLVDKVPQGKSVPLWSGRGKGQRNGGIQVSGVADSVSSQLSRLDECGLDDQRSYSHDPFFGVAVLRLRINQLGHSPLVSLSVMMITAPCDSGTDVQIARLHRASRESGTSFHASQGACRWTQARQEWQRGPGHPLNRRTRPRN